MAQTMTVPELGENVESVEVVAILVGVGDTIAVDQPVIEVETDKASVEVPSTVAGVVSEVHVMVGDTVSAGAPIISVDGARPTAGAEGQTEAASPAAAPATEAARATAPEEPGDQAETEPSVAPAPAPAAAPSPSRERGAAGPRALVPAAPTVRRLAREIGVDIARVSGSGPGGRITIDDVKAHANRLLGGAAQGSGDRVLPELPDLEAWGAVRREPMTRVRQVTAANLARAASTVAQVTHHDLADITELEELRKRYRSRVEAAGGALTLTAIVVKVAASALKVFPKLNASIDPANRQVVFKQYVHIGVAVDTDRGLLVPVVRDVESKNITQIAVELGDLAQRARVRKLMPDEMQGASFTVSNLGGIGGTAFSPIVNWPEVAILGVSRGRVEAVWNGGEFRPRLMLPLSVSYDHRLIDGADAARFLRWLAEALEQPLLLALEG